MNRDIAIDLGTANFLIIHDGNVVVDQPSVVAFDRSTNKMIAVGNEAMQMEGKTHANIRTVRPLQGGVIADFNAAEQMIRGMMAMAGFKRSFFKPFIRMVVCIPSGITEVEKRAVEDSAETLGASKLYLIHEPIAAAVGIGLDVEEPEGNMIVDIGGGTTEIALIASSGIICNQSIRIAGNALDADIELYIRHEYNLMIGQPTAERIKQAVGAALTDLPESQKECEVMGRDLLTGMPKQIVVNQAEIAHCLDKSIAKIEESVMKLLEVMPPELAGDIYQRGMYLSGGGALLHGLDKRLALKTHLHVHTVEDPLRMVVRGAGIALKTIGKSNYLIK
ncbi:rod shape-determining protein [Arundinibacter roseus]|uniref:Cell shape-determining protein MreB n=1 Tax=Arundinibacter roseus TaxID=2070510 RepID=A0A4R4KGG3_9BACT|nr:rod shape-determining protein [Arundinibacter roseus]TDB66763.1 rod shape-determining protein [Arundinibacter roseus]